MNMRFGVLAGAAALLIAAAPGDAAAQSGDWWGWALQELDRDGEWERGRGGDDRDRDRDRDGGVLGDIFDDRDRDRYEDRRRGPPFCRNGQGHPVHGRRWCVEKGFGLGDDDFGWDRRGGLEDIIFRSPRDRRYEDRGGLIDVLGDVVFGRFDAERRQRGSDRPLNGRWLRPNGNVRVLQIRSGNLPIAELTDLNADGRVDVVLVPRR